MNYKRMLNKLFTASVISYFVMSADFLFMPFEDNKRITEIICGAVFWMGLIVGSIMFIRYNKMCKEACLNQNERKINLENKKTGIISFFSNKYASVADLLLFMSVILFVLLMIFSDRNSYMCYVSIGLLIFTFIMHCILNGKIFYAHQKLLK